MRIIKLAFIVFIIVVLFEHREQIHLPLSFGGHSQEHLQDRVQYLEQQISQRNEILGSINELIAKAPRVGTVINRSACGATTTVIDSGATQMQSEVNRLQGEINTLDRELQDAKRKLAESR